MITLTEYVEYSVLLIPEVLNSWMSMVVLSFFTS